MKKLVLMTTLLLSFATVSNAQTSACNTFAGTTGLSEYDPNSVVTYSVASNELTIDFTNASPWGNNEVKWDFPATIDLSSASTTAIISLDVLASASPALLVSGGTCGANTNYFPLAISFYDGSGNYSGGFSSASVQASYTTYHSITGGSATITWNSCVNTAVKGISIKPGDPGNGCNNATAMVNAEIKIKNLAINTSSCSATGTTNATSIASSNLYPNPTSDITRLELDLKAVSSVKVTLSDLMGKEVMVISEGTMGSLSKEFSVASLTKGIYTVNYFVNGAAAKSELLMVK